MAGGGKPKFYGVAAGRKPGVYTEPGLGPLPLNAVDGFDPSLKLDDKTGNIRVKTDKELGKRKRQPTGDFKGPVVVYTDGGSRGNGNAGAKAGCGVYFGPRDPRSVSWQTAYAAAWSIY
jgi:ribonuclease HI